MSQNSGARPSGRPRSGSVIEHRAKAGTTSFRLRVTANGRRHLIRLGTDAEGWDREAAERQLAYVVQQIEFGDWLPPVQLPSHGTDAPSFHAFASEWAARKWPVLGTKTRELYTWILRDHLLPFFKDFAVDQIDIAAVDRYRANKVRERDSLRAAAGASVERKPLSNETINKSLKLLAQIFDEAVEYGLATINPARGRKRRLPSSRPQRTFLEPYQVRALLEAAGQLDAEAASHAARRRVRRRVALSLLVLGGLRISEMCALHWEDLDLSAARVHVREYKTDAGVREVDMPASVIAELVELRTECDPDPRDLVLGTKNGNELNPSNLRNRVLTPAIERANELLADADEPAIAARITPHSLRRTYITLVLMSGADPRYVMSQVGHEDAKLTLEIYAQVVKRRQRDHAQALDELIAARTASPV